MRENKDEEEKIKKLLNLHDKKIFLVFIGGILIIIGIYANVSGDQQYKIAYQGIITLGITLISISTVGFLFESEGWQNTIKELITDLMLDPQFVLQQGIKQSKIRKNIMKMIKGGLKIDILDDAFFTAVDEGYIQKLMEPIWNNINLRFILEVKEIDGHKYVEVTLKRSFNTFNPTQESILLFTNKTAIKGNYEVDDILKTYVKDGHIKIHSVDLFEIEGEEQDLSDIYKQKVKEEGKIVEIELSCDKYLRPYSENREIINVELIERICLLKNDFFVYQIKNVAKHTLIQLDFPDELTVEGLLSQHRFPPGGIFAKEIKGKKGHKEIRFDQILFPGACIFVYWTTDE